MDRKAFRNLLARRILVMDGAMGTELLRLGCTMTDCLELVNRERAELVSSIHQQYLDAGADIISTNTFGANRFRLGRHRLAADVRDLVQRGVALARQASGGRALIALSVGPSGLTMGGNQEATFPLLVEGFREQIAAGVAAGADLISLETMTDVQELKAAVVAARQVCDLPILAQLTFDSRLQTPSGTPAATAAAVLSGLDIDVIGANCSCGPEQLRAVMAQMSSMGSLPLIVQPNAGLPRIDEAGRLQYPVTPQMMADAVGEFIRLGVRVIGSCCGTTPEFTRAIAAANRTVAHGPVIPDCRDGFLASRTEHLTVSHHTSPVLIGERFCALYRSDLRQALARGERLPLMDEAVEQRSAGAQGINISVSAPGLAEASAMELAVMTVQKTVGLPLSIQTSDPDTLEAALQLVHGRALINAVPATEEGLARLLPLARRYGAMAVVIPQYERDSSTDAQQMLGAARVALDHALRLGLRPQDIVVDCLSGVAASGRTGLEMTLRLSELIHAELGLLTLSGLSGVSMGKKQRGALNAAYAAMMVLAGADILIANPLQREVVSSIRASAELMGRVG